MLRILLTGGGTGGHIYPLIAVAQKLREISASENLRLDLVYLGSYGSFLETLSAENIRVIKITGGKFRNYTSILNILDIFRTTFSFFEAWVKLFFLMPDIIYSEGGPGALPVVLMGRFYRIPIIIHEANVIPGRTNIVSARVAQRIGIAFAGAAKYFKGKNVALVGNPMRKELTENVPNQVFAKTELKFSNTIPLLLVLGGSQGSTRINDFIFANLDFLISNFQILHQVGESNYEDAKGKVGFLLKNFTSEEQSRFRLVPYFETTDAIKTAYAAADLIVGRAGAGTIFEIAAFKKPSILIPLPEGYDQRANAYEFAETGATLVLEQGNLLPNLFREQVIKILSDKLLQTKMSEAAGKFAKPDAAGIVAEEILKLATNN